MKMGDKLNILCESMGNSGVMMIILIYLMAGGFQAPLPSWAVRSPW